MNCYHKFLQKNVYRTCGRNCDEIASVTTFHRNDKGLVTRTADKSLARDKTKKILAYNIFKNQSSHKIK